MKIGAVAWDHARGHPHWQPPVRQYRQRSRWRHLQHRHTGAATFTSSRVTSNTANQAGGFASVNATLTLTSSTVTTNAALVNLGGVCYVAGSATLNTSTVTANIPTNCTNSPSPVPGCIG